jgi:hypothetical protein
MRIRSRRSALFVAVTVTAAFVGLFLYAFRSTATFEELQSLQNVPGLPPCLEDIPFEGPVAYAVVLQGGRVSWLVSGTVNAQTAKSLGVDNGVFMEEFSPPLRMAAGLTGAHASAFLFPRQTYYYVSSGPFGPSPAARSGVHDAYYCPESGRLTIWVKELQ